jgi:predicted nucleotidyltransferase
MATVSMPPDRESVLAVLRAREAELRAAGIAALYLFGSAARGEATAASDVDLFFDQANPDGFDLFDLVDVGERIGDALGGIRVDLATRGSLHPVLRPAIESGAIRVF